METPLLSPRLSTGGEHGDYGEVQSLKEMKSVFWIETVKMWKIATPIVLATMCQYGINSMTNIFAGHIGDLELSAVSISLSVIGSFSFGFMLGMGSALETLCGQAFGAGQVHMLGIYMQRSWIILLVSCFILLPVYIFATPILKLLGQDEKVAELAGNFTLLVIPELFSLAINFPAQKFLQAQSKVWVVACIGIVCFLLHIPLLWLLISVCGLGTTGAAIAYNITYWGLSVAQVVYIIGWCNEGWNGFSWSAFKDIWGFVRLSLASAVMLCLEIWYLMSIIVLTGHLDNAIIAVGSLSICINIKGWLAMLFIGINAAISVRVSNELGSGHHRAAKYSVYVTVFQSFLIGILSMVIILISKDYFALIFTDSKDMQTAASKLVYLLAVNMLLDSVQLVIGGVAIGSGWQALVAYINIGSYYLFGIPLGYVLGYRANLGVKGLWGGMLAGTVLQTVLLLIVLYRTNWNKEVEQTSERVRKWGGQQNYVDKTENLPIKESF
ncbi:protein DETOXIFICATION 35-like [Mercurialis annua]|uniref:protein DETOXIFICATION 35-like n=1 Tax=Mercurialis annua TaxID=3986 RepID=UPI0021606A25|nr:protein DETOXIFICATION 35-like [Mercurialis annua]